MKDDDGFGLDESETVARGPGSWMGDSVRDFWGQFAISAQRIMPPEVMPMTSVLADHDARAELWRWMLGEMGVAGRDDRSWETAICAFNMALPVTTLFVDRARRLQMAGFDALLDMGDGLHGLSLWAANPEAVMSQSVLVCSVVSDPTWVVKAVRALRDVGCELDDVLMVCSIQGAAMVVEAETNARTSAWLELSDLGPMRAAEMPFTGE